MKNDAGIKARQQVIDKINSVNNILVTVSKNPSVDELSAALGLTTILNKIDKHGTVIFSGAIPPAINFLEPEKIFENTVDSLRDFIIALDKEKADHLRYKIEGDVVKIFITPYHSVITEKDFNYSQGDYNVELVLALGVSNKEHLDAAISAHGQMLHDADIMTLSASGQSSRLGSVDWQDENASCLCEMVANIGDALKVNNKSIIDKQIATALLTGIVAATERFSNIKTSSRVMTIAAQLMAAGADQQLIAAKLQESHEIKELDDNPKDVVVVEPPKEPKPVEPEKPADSIPGSLVIEHENKASETASEPEVIYASTIGIEPSIPAESPNSSILNLDNSVGMDSIDVAPAINTDKEELSDAYADSTDELPEIDAQTESPLAVSPASVENEPEVNLLTQEPVKTQPILSHASYLKEDDNESMPINSSVVSEEPSGSGVDFFASSPQTVIQPTMPDLPMPPAVPDFSTLPPQPTEQFGIVTADEAAQTTPPVSINNNDPSQFRIPS